jgi:hypothetical protein
MNTSNTRMISMSAVPPKYADNAPNEPPMAMPIAFTATATKSELRPPCRILDRMSLPLGSVPRKWPEEKAGR